MVLRPELAVNIMSCAGMTVCGSALGTGLFHFVNSSLLLVKIRAQPAEFVSLQERSEVHAEALSCHSCQKSYMELLPNLFIS